MSESKADASVPGACLCGAIQYEIDLPTLGSVHCHCTMCRRWNGAGYTSWCAVAKDQLRILSGEKQLVRYQSSDHAGRFFCSVCGSSLFGDPSSGGLEERGQALATTDAHGDDAVALALPLELAQQQARHA